MFVVVLELSWWKIYCNHTWDHFVCFVVVCLSVYLLSFWLIFILYHLINYWVELKFNLILPCHSWVDGWKDIIIYSGALSVRMLSFWLMFIPYLILPCQLGGCMETYWKRVIIDSVHLACLNVVILAYVHIIWSRCSSLVQFSSVQDGIYALGKAHVHSTPSLRSFPNVALETVPMLVWQTMALSRPLKNTARLNCG